MGRQQKNGIIVLGIGFLIISIIVLGACNSRYKTVALSDKQVESLCDQYAEVDEHYADIVPTKAAGAIHLYGVERDGDIGYIYCYISEGTYVKVNNKAYNISGGNGPEILTIQFDGDEVVLLDRESSVSSLVTLEKYPLKYRLMDRFYDAYTSDGFCKLQIEEAKKIEDFWEVEVELKYCIDIYENGTYEVWDFPHDEKVTIETGKIE